MKPRLAKKRNAAMTLLEVLVVIVVMVILAAAFLPMLAKKKTSRIGCIQNLKLVGLSYRLWAGDKGDIYPMEISIANGGSMEMVATGDVVQTFQVMSNELGTPKILICPKDSSRFPATNFGAGLASSNISYFVGVDVTNNINPQMIISGDCSFEIGDKPVKPGLNSFWTTDPVAWSPTTRHIKTGYIGLNDGSVQSTTSKSLQNYFQQTGLATNRFAIP